MQESILVSPQGRSRMVIVGGAVGGGFGLMVALLLLTFAVAAIYIFTRRRYVLVSRSVIFNALDHHIVVLPESHITKPFIDHIW